MRRQTRSNTSVTLIRSSVVLAADPTSFQGSCFCKHLIATKPGEKCLHHLSGAEVLSGKEPLDNSCRVFRVFFREEVTAFHCLSMHVRSPLPPNAERTPVFCIERVERATLGPEMQHRAFDSPGCFLVSTIVFDIDRGCGSIFLTDAMNAGRIAIGGKVFFENLWTKGTVPKGILENGLGSTEQIALRERLLLCQ